ncbi:hypothetical protein OsJ_06661 [Oryza sativa Japonica Group]|uniref:Uncharacterized protein n=1 Tax=Oryza sativa subsp. japonica TaxID=39947 RepID=B9EZW2_ORYSJ|nr:hypothetical protein OsJ_06661 [Oryza sativa Japonica Group]
MVAMRGASPVVVLVLVASVLAPGAMSAKFVFTNNCHEVLYPGVLTPATAQAFPTTGFELQPGASAAYDGVPDNWSGNIWARRLCSTDASGRFSCESGDCGTGRGAGGAVVGCKSGCLAFGRDDLCCRGAYGTPDKCPPSQYSKFFKDKCPQAYSYAYDDKSSTFTCTSGASYQITFCP